MEIKPKPSKYNVDNTKQINHNTETLTKQENIRVINTNITNRKVVTMTLIDNDQGIQAEDSVVHVFQGVVVENGDIESAKQELLMNEKVSKIIEDHNSKRANMINEDILNRTGNEVKLRAIKLKDLTWQVS